MAYTVTLYKFSKKKNSTAQPGQATPKLVMSCRLMDNSGMLEPTFRFDFAHILNEDPIDYNYAYVAEFKRYYFITNWSYNLGLWNCSMSVDPLASFKTDIGNVHTFVKRCSYTNVGEYIDDVYPLRATGDITNVMDPGPFTGNTSNGCFVLGVVGMYATTGSINYYVMDRPAFTDLIARMFSSVSYLNVTEISDGLQKALFNPIQYIASAFYFPFALSNITSKTAVTQVNFGWWNITGVGNTYLLGPNPHVEFQTQFTIPKHPNYATLGAYMNLSPFTKYTLIFHPYGQWDIDTTILSRYRTLRLQQSIDLISGSGVLYQAVYEENTEQNLYFDTRMCNIAVPISMAQVSSDVMGAVGGGVGALASAFNGNLGGALGGLVSSASAMIPKAQIFGSNGGFNTYNLNIILQCQFMNHSFRNPDVYGYPYYDNATISNIPGYIEAEPELNQFTCTKTELEEIDNYFISGFHYE